MTFHNVAALELPERLSHRRPADPEQGLEFLLGRQRIAGGEPAFFDQRLESLTVAAELAPANGPLHVDLAELHLEKFEEQVMALAIEFKDGNASMRRASLSELSEW